MGFFWFHLFSSLENTEDMTPYTLVELGLRSHVKLGRNLYHNYSSQKGREMKNASFFYLVSSEIMDINPVPRWMRGFLFFFLLSPQLLGSQPSYLQVRFIYLGKDGGWTVAAIFHILAVL